MPNEPTIYDCELIHLSKLGDRDGYISPVTSHLDIPFAINRVFYLYDIPAGESRGGHAHRQCHQFLVAGSGAFEVMVDDGRLKKNVRLDQPHIGFHIPPDIWVAEHSFSSGAICLVLASHEYDANDYIRDYGDYLKARAHG